MYDFNLFKEQGNYTILLDNKHKLAVTTHGYHLALFDQACKECNGVESIAFENTKEGIPYSNPIMLADKNDKKTKAVRLTG